MFSKIASIGVYNPEQVFDNETLGRIIAIGPDEDKIRAVGADKLGEKYRSLEERIGIKKRRIATSTETNQTMALEAALNAIDSPLTHLPQIDYVIVATNTNKKNFPSTAMFVQHGIRERRPDAIHPRASGFDLGAGCAGINISLEVGDALVRSGKYKAILLIGTEHLSSITDYSHRDAMLFGDGASAYVLIASESPGFVGHYTLGDGSKQDKLFHGPREKSHSVERVFGREDAMLKGRCVLQMDGRPVFNYVVSEMTRLAIEFPTIASLNPEGVSFEEVRFIVPHQANELMFKRIDESVPGFLNRCQVTIGEYGNTSTASQGRPLKNVLYGNEVQEGDLILMAGYGAGLTMGANLYKVPYAPR